MNNNNIIIKTMQEADLDAVLAIQAQAYRPYFHEARTCFAEKLRLYPQGCWVAWDDMRPAAYLVSHSWSQDQIVALHAPLQQLPQHPDCYYIHDLSVSPAFHGKGLGRIMVEKAKECALNIGLKTILLVAVQGSQSFWSKFGFQSLQPPSATIKKMLDSYQDACLMMAVI
ncbi:GCN5-related N-acetyltransferase [Candidatus Vecturithrix granuli]|uniref:GCN5-related N-acetyltransferase n=1 Tax=Vecturithrix granuli TaxID=1499967 RepID=A0A0S6W914_VECG1|nr:GCN5-related N-acetyltransferase [Candidatus Vecturithrix granuli]